jgi:hypothetical protein
MMKELVRYIDRTVTQPMSTRFKFASVAGVTGLLLGCVAAVVLHDGKEAFPYHIVAAFTVTFAACGFVGKKEWFEEVIAFFVSWMR